MDVYKHATSIVNRLVRAGHTAYFAGGWVRDYVMGHPSEDIDIATSASSVEVMDLFPNTILVGLAFGVVIVTIEGHQYEVATFRRDINYSDGRRPESIEHSTPQEDAYRRDFTINGMFYDPIEHQIHDYVNGREDIHRGIIRTIGDPDERFFEDRLRMLRAFRFAARFGFTIEIETQDAIRANAMNLFPSVAMERVWQEFNKMASYPRFDQAIVEMHHLSLLEEIFPEIQGLHLNDLRHLVSSYAQFPKETPTILYLMELFPSASLLQKMDISKKIKATNKDIKLLEFIDRLSHAIQKEEKQEEIDRYSWAYLYAHPSSHLCLEVLAARLSPEKRLVFIQKHQNRFQQLEPHIHRLQAGRPLISAAFLQAQGIKPGKQMGELLKEAEKIAINENRQNVQEIFYRLASTPIWRQYHAP